MIRVIRGIYKGKRLKRVPDPAVRPMPDKLKEALFHIIDRNVRGSVFLDGFAGTGSVGLEALSRGAETVVFVDEYYPAVKVLKANIAKCEAEDRSRVMHKEFNRAVIQLAKEKARFDIVFLDPPYKLIEERNPLKVVFKREILKKGGQVILRRRRKTAFEARYFTRRRTVTLGDDAIDFYS